MKPVLKAIKLVKVGIGSSLVSISYLGDDDMHGIELMGIEAGLSWIKNESIQMEKSSSEEVNVYSKVIEVVNYCEFRARGFISDEDFWEDGAVNHKLIRNEDGTIELETDELIYDSIELKKNEPTNFEIGEEDALLQVNNLEENPIKLLQLLVNLSYWTKDLFTNPLENENIHHLPFLIRYLKEYSRLIESHKLDLVVRPVYNAFFDIYLSTITFSEEDERILLGKFDKQKYPELMSGLMDAAKKLDNEVIADRDDKEQRLLALMEYV